MHVPFRRFAWIAAALWLPAAVGGWGMHFFPSLESLYGFAYFLAFMICLVLVPLSWSDHVAGQTGKGCLGACAMMGAIAGVLYLLARYGEGVPLVNALMVPLLASLVYLVPVLLVGLANPEGMTVFLLLVQAFIAGGLAQGADSHHHPWLLAVLVPGLALVGGLGSGLVRRILR